MRPVHFHRTGKAIFLSVRLGQRMRRAVFEGWTYPPRANHDFPSAG